MITENSIKYLEQRLGPIIKYTCSGPFYWDAESNKFIPLHSFNLIQWRATYLLGHVFEACFFIYIIQAISFKDIPEETQVETTDKFNTDILMIGVGLAVWFLVGSLTCINSVCVQYQQEMATSLNQMLKLDAYLMQRF